MSEIPTIGLDLAKSVFQVHGVNEAGGEVTRKRLRRGQMLTFFAGLPPCLVGMEACATAHYWARELRDPKFAQAMGFTSIPQTTIPAGEKRDINSVVVIPLGINNPSGGAEANQFSFELAYDTGSGQRGEQLNVNEGIVFTITNPPDASGRWSRIAKSCRSNSGRSKTVTSHLPQSNAFAMIVLGIALAHAQAVWSGC
jgi:hypothetical protein